MKGKINMDIVVEIWTDGACSGNPGPGGCAAIMKYDGGSSYFAGREVYSTNQRMEILAVLRGLEMWNKVSKRADKIIIYSDSAYVCNCFKQKWYYNWKKNGWLNSKKQPVANTDLWIPLINLVEAFENNNTTIIFEKVKGHSGNTMNEECDKLAVLARKGENIDDC